MVLIIINIINVLIIFFNHFDFAINIIIIGIKKKVWMFR